MDKAREAKLKKYCEIINKAVPKAALTYIGSDEVEPLERFGSGSANLDAALGGGWPLGRIVEVYGPASAGKTSLCYHAIAEFQKKFPDGDVAWIDSEFSLDSSYAEKLGVNIDQMLVQQPECGEDALNVIKQLIMAGVKLIVVDSVAALTPRAELEKDIGERTVGETARLMSSGLRQLVAEAGKHNAIIMFTNQIRDKIGVMGWGEKTTTTGGKALGFYTSIRLDVRIIGSEKEGEVVVSNRIKAVTKKNKTFAPMRESNFILTFGVGIDNIAEVFDMAVAQEIIEKAGAWFSMDGERVGQGRATCLELMRTNKEFYEKVKSKLNKKTVDEKKDNGTVVQDTKKVEGVEGRNEPPSENAETQEFLPKKRGRPKKIDVTETTETGEIQEVTQDEEEKEEISVEDA